MTVDGEDVSNTSPTALAGQSSRAQATAWSLALLPVTYVAYDVIALELFGAAHAEAYKLSQLFALFTTWAVVVADSEALRSAGVRVSAWWGILLLPVYVILRTKRARSSWVIPALFFTLAIAYQLSLDRLVLDALDLP